MIRSPRDLGALVREERTAAGLNQQALADRAGVSRLWISDLENGNSGAGIGRVLRTLAVLGVELQPRFLYEGQPDDKGRRPNSADLIRRVLGQDDGQGTG